MRCSFGNVCDQFLLNFCGLENHAFRALLHEFEPIYEHYTPYSEYVSMRRLSVPISVGQVQ